MLDPYEHAEAELDEMLRALASLRVQTDARTPFPGLAATMAWIAALDPNLGHVEAPAVTGIWMSGWGTRSICHATEEPRDGCDGHLIHDIVGEHRERVAAALVDGLVIGRSGKVILAPFSGTDGGACRGYPAGRPAGAVTRLAGDDLADLAVAFDQDPAAFLAGILEPALEGDGVA
jgi:hypothetical protein